LKGKYKRKREPMSSPTEPTKPNVQPAQPSDPKSTTNSTGPETPRDTPVRPKVEPAPKQQRERRQYKPDSTPLWKMILEIGAVVVGLYVAYIYHGQLGEMIEGNRISRENSTKTQGATVVFPASDIKVSGVGNPAIKGTPMIAWAFSVPAENIGATRTRNAKFVVNGDFLMGKLPANFDFHDLSNPINAVIPGHSTISFPTLATGVQQIQSVQRGIGHLYLYGWARYKDIFENTPEHITKFCYELTLFNHDPTKPKTSDPSDGYLEFRAREQHNCIDEECKTENGPPSDFTFKEFP
jgi:hypothetical protein